MDTVGSIKSQNLTCCWRKGKNKVERIVHPRHLTIRFLCRTYISSRHTANWETAYWARAKNNKLKQI